MSRQHPTTAENAGKLFELFVARGVIPGILGFVAMTFVAYVLPIMFDRMTSGVSFQNSVRHGLNNAGERLSIGFADPSQLLYGLGIPAIGAVIGIVIAIAKADDD